MTESEWKLEKAELEKKLAHIQEEHEQIKGLLKATDEFMKVLDTPGVKVNCPNQATLDLLNEKHNKMPKPLWSEAGSW